MQVMSSVEIIRLASFTPLVWGCGISAVNSIEWQKWQSSWRKEKGAESRKWRHKSMLLYFVWEFADVQFSSTAQSFSSSEDFQTFWPCFCRALCASKDGESWLCVVSTLRSPCVALYAALFLEQHQQDESGKKPFLWKSQIMPLSEVS